ncbi:tetratricopeptide repeat protein [Parabacteroides sp. GYB001]|uniref:tetratricopeptide repeat protein n=1 Tax=Parabacteroides leei TaxID=2939491 RepID=UPI0020183CC8|nr:tetratricopeptide repeat protein [Parabacteroides leei]MCL3851285.1 tetratricopeptide repeat protein [Parabacteroides leei]
MINKPGNIVLQISFVISLLCLVSCSNRTSVSTELNKARSLMEMASDSSLAILDNITSPEKLSEKEYAAYCLLLTQALDKNYYIHDSDSLIMIATNYYEKHNDLLPLALSYYYAGRVYSDMQDALQAQQYYLKALALGESLNLPELLIKINSNLGTLYSYQDIYEMALPLYKKTLPLFENTNDSTNMSFVLRNIARVFTETHQPDSAIYYYEQAIKIATPQSISALQNGLGSLYLQMEKYDEAYICIQKAIQSCNSPKLLYPFYLNLGEYYYKTMQHDSAQHYLNRSLQSPILYTQAGSLYFLAQIEKQKLDFKNYLKYWDQYEQLRDSIDHDSHFENIRIAQSMFNYQRISDEKNKYEQEATQRMIIIYQILIIITALLIIFFFFFKKEQQKKKRLLDLKEKLYKQSLEYLEENKKKIALLEQELSSGQETIGDVKRQLFETRKLMLEMENRQISLKHDTMLLVEQDLRKSTLYTKIHQTEEKLSDSEWSELFLLVDATYPNFKKGLLELCSRISLEELRICYLVKINIPVKRIAILMNITSSGVSQCRRRLYKKLTKEAENAEKFDSFIAGL